MARNLVGILSVVSCCLGVWCYHYHVHMKKLQADNAALQNRLEAAELSLVKQKSTNEELASRVVASNRQLEEATRREECLLRQVEEIGKAVSEKDTVVKLTPETAETGKEDKGVGGFMDKLKELMDKPGMRDAMRSQQKFALNMMYGTLFEKLKLDPERLEVLKDLLVDRQMTGLDAAGSKDPKLMVEAQQELDAAVKELLSEEEFSTFQDYQKTLGERIVIQQVDQVLAQKSMALTEVQREELITLMVEERQALAFPSAQEQQEQWLSGESDTAQLESLFKRQAELNRRILARADEVLTEEQVKELGTFQESQLQMQRLGVQMMKNMAGGGKKE